MHQGTVSAKLPIPQEAAGRRARMHPPPPAATCMQACLPQPGGREGCFGGAELGSYTLGQGTEHRLCTGSRAKFPVTAVGDSLTLLHELTHTCPCLRVLQGLGGHHRKRAIHTVPVRSVPLRAGAWGQNSVESGPREQRAYRGSGWRVIWFVNCSE